MREKKFRAWDTKRKKFINDFVLSPDGCVMCEGSPHLYYEGLHETKIKLMQFTGLPDKHGKEIYEGDICQTDVNKKMWKVVFMRYSFWFVRIDCNDKQYVQEQYSFHEYLFMLKKASAAIVVIGSIYEIIDSLNSELLAQECDASKGDSSNKDGSMNTKR